MTIRKAIITVTVLFDDTLDTVENFNEMGLKAILEECDSGHMLGQSVTTSIVEVPNENVIAEEKALGCDGTFFADPDALWDSQNGQDGQ